MIETINEFNYHDVLRTFDNLFSPCDGNVLDFYLKDKRLSKQLFNVKLFQFREVFDANVNPPETYMVAAVELHSSINTRLILHIELDDPTSYGGLFIMTFDYELSDDVCMVLYDQDIAIAYEILMGDDDYLDPVMIYYDRVGIHRRQTIKHIIES